MRIKALIAFALALLTAGLCNGEQLRVSMLDSLAIPVNYEFQYYYQMPNGDIQFYDLDYGANSITFKGFRYLAQSNELTQRIVLGNAMGLNWQNQYRRTARLEYDRLNLIHFLNDGFVVFLLAGDNLSSHYCNEFSFDQYFNYSSDFELVAPDAVAIALADSLVYYNFVQQTSTAILQGAEYQCVWENPLLTLLPGDLFMYVKDCVSMTVGAEESWFVFDSAGTLLFSQTRQDEVLNSNLMGKAQTRPQLVHGKWYQSAPGLIEELDGQLECTLLEEEIHYHHFGFGIEQYMAGAYAFSDQRVLRLIIDHPWDWADFVLICNQSPVELFPEVIYSFYFGNHYPTVANFGEGIVTLSFALPGQAAVLALWDADFPTLHEFYFPAYTAPGNYFSCVTQGYLLRLINARRIYTLAVDVVSSLPGEELPPPESALRAFPNPARRGQSVIFECNVKHSGNLEIFNLRGQKVRSLPLVGEKSISWNRLDDGGKPLPAGIYFARFQSLDTAPVVRFVLLD